MNIHSFKDVITSKRSALVNDVGDDFDEDEEREVAPMKKAIEGEEDEGTERVIFIYFCIFLKLIEFLSV